MNTASAEAQAAQAQDQPVQTGKPVLTMEYKERQWLGYWARAHGEYSEPFNGHEKKLWWRQTFGEEYRAPTVRAGAEHA